MRGSPARLWLGAAVVLTLLQGPAAARQPVLVGGYQFAPYVELEPDGSVGGLAPALIEELNRVQDDYDFRFFLTSPARRWSDFEAGRFDVIFFESPAWGWRERGLAVEASEVFLTDSEVFVTLAEPGRHQSYFWDLEGKVVAGLLGYHYAFVGYDSDPLRLERDQGMMLVNDNAASIELVRLGRADLAVVTRSFLLRYLRQRPELRGQLLESEVPDQVYEHRALVRQGSRPGPAEIDALLQHLDAEGLLEALWQRAGIRE